MVGSLGTSYPLLYMYTLLRTDAIYLLKKVQRQTSYLKVALMTEESTEHPQAYDERIKDSKANSQIFKESLNRAFHKENITDCMNEHCCTLTQINSLNIDANISLFEIKSNNVTAVHNCLQLEGQVHDVTHNCSITVLG